MVKRKINNKKEKKTLKEKKSQEKRGIKNETK